MKRKLLNGEITDNTRAGHAIPLLFDNILIMLVTGSRQNDRNRIRTAEEEFEVQFLKWI